MLTLDYQKQLIALINASAAACFTVWLDSMVGTWGITPKEFEHNGDFYATPFWEETPGVSVFAASDDGEIILSDVQVYRVGGDPAKDAASYIEIMNDQVVSLYECIQTGFKKHFGEVDGVTLIARGPEAPPAPTKGELSLPDLIAARNAMESWVDVMTDNDDLEAALVVARVQKTIDTFNRVIEQMEAPEKPRLRLVKSEEEK